MANTTVVQSSPRSFLNVTAFSSSSASANRAVAFMFIDPRRQPPPVGAWTGESGSALDMDGALMGEEGDPDNETEAEVGHHHVPAPEEKEFVESERVGGPWGCWVWE